MNLDVIEKYDRPCFAACSGCGKHGVIVFKDGSHSEDIMSIDGGLELLKKLEKEGKITSADADRILSHLECSDMVRTENDVITSAILSLMIKVLRERPSGTDSSCPHPEWN